MKHVLVSAICLAVAVSPAFAKKRGNSYSARSAVSVQTTSVPASPSSAPTKEFAATVAKASGPKAKASASGSISVSFGSGGSGTTITYGAKTSGGFTKFVGSEPPYSDGCVGKCSIP